MARRGGKRPNAGRKAGSVVRGTIENRDAIGELARAHTEVALQALVKVATKSDSDAARVSAASALLDRGYGKPRQTAEITGKDGGPIQTEDAGGYDLARRIAMALAGGLKSE